jgi:hypothetical protein
LAQPWKRLGGKKLIGPPLCIKNIVFKRNVGRGCLDPVNLCQEVFRYSEEDAGKASAEYFLLCSLRSISATIHSILGLVEGKSSRDIVAELDDFETPSGSRSEPQ